MCQEDQPTQNNFEDYVGSGQIFPDNTLLLKGYTLIPEDQEFEINAEYSGSDCDGKLTSFSFINAQFPLTWHELDNKGNIVRSDLNLPIEELKNNTNYLVEDKTKHTDTVFIQFDQSIRINKIYPNPATEFTWIEFNTHNELEILILLFDLSGKLLSKIETTVNQEENRALLKMSDLSKGLYLLKIKAHCINETRKVVYLDY